MLIAVDHGNHAIKTVHYNFISGLAQHSVRPPMADEVLEYKGEYWTLSGQRLPYRRDKTRDESFFILTLSFSPCLLSQKSFPMPVLCPQRRKLSWR